MYRKPIDWSKAETPEDIDRLLQTFKERFGRAPDREELAQLQYVRNVLVEKQRTPRDA